jgi:two-component system, cell cycle sensor histidine kinase and response regulator CckA
MQANKKVVEIWLLVVLIVLSIVLSFGKIFGGLSLFYSFASGIIISGVLTLMLVFKMSDYYFPKTPRPSNVASIRLVATNNNEEQEIHAQRMQAVGQLAGGIAHDFNNLLTAMIGFCDLLLMKHKAGDSSFADIMQIKQNGIRAASLVGQLLAFSRKQTVQLKTIDITDHIAETSNLLTRLIGPNIKLEIDYGRNLHNISIDKTHLEQILINLVVNSRDAINSSPRGNEGQIKITTRNEVVRSDNYIPTGFLTPLPKGVASGDYVSISVEDNGCGMTPDIIGKIFEPFFTTKDVGKGTGLGMATVYGILEQISGAIFCYSRVDNGTTFKVYLKKAENDEERIISAENTPSIGIAANITATTESIMADDMTGSATILLVEDETPVRIFATRTLENKGYTVIAAPSADDALAMVERDGLAHIDLIISDVMMPGTTGPEMVKILIEKYGDIKVIFISGYGEDAFGDVFGEKRNFNFLPKPFELKSLVEKVKIVLQMR